MNFKGQSVVVAGNFEATSKREIAEKLRARGAYIAKTVSSRTALLIAGTRHGRMVEHARMRGVTVYNEAQYLAMMDGADSDAIAQLALSEPSLEPVSLNDALTEFRGLLYDTPTEETWARICALMDRCSPETAPLAVDYVNERTQNWPSGHNLGRLTSWEGNDDLREAPPSWIEAVIRGEDDPKFALIRSLDMGNRKLTGKVASNLLKCPHLKSLKMLNLDSNKLSASFFKDFLASGFLAGLTHLSLAWLTLASHHVAAFDTPHALASLEALNLSRTKFDRPESLGRLLQTSVFDNLQHLELSHVRLRGSLALEGLGAMIAAASNISRLRKLILFGAGLGTQGLRDMLGAEHLAHLEVLDIQSNNLTPEGLAPLTSSARWHNLRRLDLLGNQDLGDEGCIPLIQAAHLSGLRDLGLQSTNTSDKTLRALATATHLDGLQSLDLVSNRMTDEGVAVLLSAPHLSSLQRLALDRNDLGDGTIDALMSATHLDKLETLLIRNIDVSDEAIAQLASAPHLASLRVLFVPYRPYPETTRAAILDSPHLSASAKRTATAFMKART